MDKIWFWKSLCDLNNPSFVLNITAGTLDDSDFVQVNTKKTWTEAQRHCREHYTDLVTGRNDTDRTKIATHITAGPNGWIGLYRDPLIYWSDGSNYSFNSWFKGDNRLDSWTVLCGVADLGGKWSFVPCEQSKSFVCYSVPSENLFCISELLAFIFVSFLKGLIELSCRKHATQRPEVPHSVF